MMRGDYKGGNVVCGNTALCRKVAFGPGPGKSGGALPDDEAPHPRSVLGS